MKRFINFKSLNLIIALGLCLFLLGNYPIQGGIVGNRVQMTFTGRPCQLQQEFVFSEMDIDPGSSFHISASFMTKDLDVDEGRTFAFRINFFKDDGTWFTADDVDLSYISASLPVPHGQNTWTQESDDGTRIRHNLGNLFVQNTTTDVKLFSQVEWMLLEADVRVPENAASMRVSLYNHGKGEGSAVIWANAKLVQIDKPEVNLFANGNFVNVNFLGELSDWQIVGGTGDQGEIIVIQE